MNYRYILFDIDNTLIDFSASFRLAARATMQMGGMDIVTEADVDRYFAENDKVWFGMELDQSDREEICRRYHPGYEEYLYQTQVVAKEVFGLKKSAKELDAYFREQLAANAVINPHVIEVLKTLKRYREDRGEGAKLAVATNGLHKLQMDKLEKFAGLFDEVFISEDLDYVKPEKKYFETIAQELNCKPEELLMVGDSLLNDIGGANGAGLDSCYYNPSEASNTSAVIPTYEIRDFEELLSILCTER